MGIGKRLKEARERCGFTQEELGRMVGVTGSAITNYEKEVSHPKEPVMYALFKALDVEPNYLFQDCVDTIKKSPAPVETNAGANKIEKQQLYNILVESGFVESGRDLSNRDLEFLLSVGDIIRAWFAKGE